MNGADEPADAATDGTPPVEIAKQLVELSLQRSYMNTERTLSVWVRTALALMVFGITVDRFGLLMRHAPWRATDPGQLVPNALSTAGGVVLVLMGVAILLFAGFRFLLYGLEWHRRNPRHVWYHTPWLAFGFAMLIALFGIAMAVVLLAFRQ